MSESDFRREMLSRTPEAVKTVLAAANILIAGAGGLGSNAAMLLVRAGAQKLTLVDFDTVAASNLNRQFYFFDQIGQLKVEALRDNLCRIAGDLELTLLRQKIGEQNLGEIVTGGYDLVLECFDRAEAKALLVQYLLTRLPQTPVIAVSGIGGFGRQGAFAVRRPWGKFYLIGDATSDADLAGTVASQVMLAAAQQVQTAIDVLMEK